MPDDAALRHRWIDAQADLDEVVSALLPLDRYALDTEFHRERTYFPKLALIQLAWETAEGQELVLIDPLAVDVSVMADLFAGDGVCVIHAAQQDLDVLHHSVGRVPSRIFARSTTPTQKPARS